MVANPGAPVVTMDRKVAAQLSPEQLARLLEIETAGRLDTDPAVYDRLDRLAVYKPKVFAVIDLSQYRLALDGRDYARFNGFQNGDATFARYDLGRTIIDARLIKAQFDPDGPETRAARNELDKTLRSFEAIEGRPPGMADIDRVAGEIVSNTARSSAPSWNQPAPQQQATDATLTANAQDTLYGAAGTDDLQGAQAGGQNDGATKPRIDPSYDPALAQLPKDVKSDKPWTIELRYHPIFHRGHAFWVLVDPDGNDKAEMHGLARSRNTGEIADVGMDGADLVVQSRPEGEPYFEWGATRIGIVASGNYDDIVVGKWNTGQKAAITINKGNFDYKAHDPAFEIGGNGGQIQNSNSVAFTLGHAMGVDLESTSRSTGNGRRFPGGDRNLLDPGYKRYVVPPMFGGVPHAP